VLGGVLGVLLLTVGGWAVLRARPGAASHAPAPARPAPVHAALPATLPVGSTQPAAAVAPAPTAAAAAAPRDPRRTPAERAARRPRGAPGPGAGGYLTVNSYPWGAVYVDGQRVASSTPMYRRPLAAGRHRVSVYNPDRKASSPTRTVVVRPGETTTAGFDW